MRSGVPLGEVAEVNPNLELRLADDDECSFVPMEAVDDVSAQIARPQVRHYRDVKKGFTPFRDGDALVAKITPCMENGKAAVARRLIGGVGFGSTEFHVVRPSPKLVAEWFHYFWLRPETRREAERHMTGSAGQKRVSATYLEELCIPLPSRDEQERKVKLLRNADRMCRVRRYALDMSEGLLGAVFREMFGDPIRNQKNWPLEVLEHVCRRPNGIKAGPFGSSLKKESYAATGIRVYGQEQVIGRDFRIGNYYISDQLFKEFEQYEVKPGDLLISLVGSFGNVVVVPTGVERGIINPRLLKVSPTEDIIRPHFLALLLKDDATQSELTRRSHGGTMGVLNAGLLRDLPIIVPPLNEQDRFVSVVQDCARADCVQRESLRQAEHLFQSLLHEAFG